MNGEERSEAGQANKARIADTVTYRSHMQVRLRWPWWGTRRRGMHHLSAMADREGVGRLAAKPMVDAQEYLVYASAISSKTYVRVPVGMQPTGFVMPRFQLLVAHRVEDVHLRVDVIA